MKRGPAILTLAVAGTLACGAAFAKPASIFSGDRKAEITYEDASWLAFDVGETINFRCKSDSCGVNSNCDFIGPFPAAMFGWDGNDNPEFFADLDQRTLERLTTDGMKAETFEKAGSTTFSGRKGVQGSAKYVIDGKKFVRSSFLVSDSDQVAILACETPEAAYASARPAYETLISGAKFAGQ